MEKLPTFKCAKCGKKLEVGEVFCLPGETYDQVGYGSVSSVEKYCGKCGEEQLEESTRLNKPSTSDVDEEIENNSGKATEKQKSYLRHLGYKEDMEELTKIEASKLIKELLKKK